MRRLAWLLGFVGGLLVIAFLVYALKVDQIDTPWAVAGGIGAALVGAWIWLDWEPLSRAMSTRGARYSWMALAMVMLAAGIAVALNVIAHRYDQRWDATSSGRYALSDQTVKVLGGLDREVEIVAFFGSGTQEQVDFEDLVAGYEQHSTLLDVSVHDPLREPVLAEQNRITTPYGTVVLRAGDATQRLESDFGEEALTNALVRLTSGSTHEVCFLEGHGELDPDEDSDPSGLGAVVVTLEGQNYQVKKITLVREGGVPASCEVVVAADPQVDWLPAEREMVAAYVAGGGTFLLMLDPVHAPALAADMARYGVSVGNDLVLEQNPTYQLVGGDMSYLILTPDSFDLHEITTPIKGMLLFRIARSVSKGADVAGVQVQELARTSDYAWAETTLDSTAAPQPDPGTDRVGQVPLIAVATVTDPSAIVVGARGVGGGRGGSVQSMLGEAPEAAPVDVAAEGGAADLATEAEAATDITRKAGGRVLVVGDSDFATNELADQGSNKDLLLNMIAWSVGEENQISIRPNEASRGTLTMSVIEGLLVALLALLVVPGLAVAGAVGTWLRRRRL